MRNSSMRAVDSLVLLSACLLVAGCAGGAGSAGKDGPAMATAGKVPPVIADLGYAEVAGRQGPISYSGGYEHVLVLPGRRPSKAAPADGGETVHFGFDHADLAPSEKAKLASFVNRIGVAGIEPLMVEGHADSAGPDGYNLRLSERRAEEVGRFLQGLGVPGRRITTVGYGEAIPALDNATDEGRAWNRRAEVQPLNGRR